MSNNQDDNATQTQDSWVNDVFGIDVPKFYDSLGSAARNDTHSAGADPTGGGDSHKHFSFTEEWMELWFGTPKDPGFLQIHEGDSDATKLARCAGTVLLLPVWGYGAVVSAVLDHGKHIIDPLVDAATRDSVQAPNSTENNTNDALQVDPAKVEELKKQAGQAYDDASKWVGDKTDEAEKAAEDLKKQAGQAWDDAAKKVDEGEQWAQQQAEAAKQQAQQQVEAVEKQAQQTYDDAKQQVEQTYEDAKKGLSDVVGSLFD
jgi:hypothetical protein